MDMLERAARAIKPNIGWGKPDQEWMKTARREALESARAVLEAIREPSIEVVMAGANEVENGDGELHRRKWQAMIDAILRDQ